MNPAFGALGLSAHLPLWRAVLLIFALTRITFVRQRNDAWKWLLNVFIFAPQSEPSSVELITKILI